MKLTGRIAILTGEAFAREDGHLVLASRRLSEVQATVAEATAMGQRAPALMLDAPLRQEVDTVGVKDTFGIIRLTEDVCRCCARVPVIGMRIS